jgi:hypothetical protein
VPPHIAGATPWGGSGRKKHVRVVATLQRLGGGRYLLRSVLGTREVVTKRLVVVIGGHHLTRGQMVQLDP